MLRLCGSNRNRSPKTRNDARLAEYDHCVEQRRRDGSADNRDACGVDEQASLDAGGFGESTKSVVAGIVIPTRECIESVGKFGQQIRNLGIFPELRASF